MVKTQDTCDARIAAHMHSRIDDVRRLWAAYQSGDEEGVEDLGTFHEYGLCFDYVPADGGEGYFRYQLSCGGPQEEFRFFTGPELMPYKIQFWFLDWFDGASRNLQGEDKALMQEIFDFFSECGTVQHVLAEAV